MHNKTQTKYTKQIHKNNTQQTKNTLKNTHKQKYTKNTQTTK